MSSSSSNRYDTANWIYVKNLWGGGEKNQPFMFILEKTENIFHNINSHILGFSHVCGRYFKTSENIDKTYTCTLISDVLEDLQLFK